MDYLFHILVIINIYAILTISSSLLVGVANLLSLGQAAFYGIGAYISALALMYLEIPATLALLIAICFTALLATLLGYISIKFEGDFFVLVTLGFQIIVYSVLYNWVNVTNGPYGIAGIRLPSIAKGFEFDSTLDFLILSSVLAFLTGFLFYKLIHSPFGRNLRAMKDDSISLEALGRSVVKLKLMTFIISAAFAAIAGFLYATYITYIDPTSFSLDESVFIISAVLIGGTGNIKGPLIGAIFVVVLPEALRFVGLPDSVAANMRMIIYGICLYLLMYYRPSGIAGKTTV